MTINFQKESWPLKAPFRTARHNLNEIETILVIASNGNRHGCGEAVGVDINGENPDLIIRQIQELRDTETDLDQLKIQTMLPPGGARNALIVLCGISNAKPRTSPYGRYWGWKRIRLIRYTRFPSSLPLPWQKLPGLLLLIPC